MATDHFQKHFIKANKVDWNFNFTFENQPAVAAMVSEYAKILQLPGLYEPVPAKWLHSTILRVGLAEDFTTEEMLAVADALRPLLAKLTLPEFSFDSWWLWNGCVVLHISPDDRFAEIYKAVITALHTVVGDRTALTPHGEFMSHTTLAYAKSEHNEKEIHDQLVANPVPPASFRATQLVLIKQWPTSGHYEWDVVSTIPIGNDSVK